MAVIAYNDSAFRVQCPAYADTGAYPESTIQNYWDLATSFVSNVPAGWLAVASRAIALNWMTAHLLFTAGTVSAQQTPNIVTGATIDKINVSLKPPETPNAWRFFLYTSPYGLQLLALLEVNSVGGWGVGGSPVSQSFNRAGPYLLRGFR